MFRLHLSATGADFPNTSCSGHEPGETLGDFTSFKWQICANDNSLRILSRADARHICRVSAFNKDFTLGTRALSSKGGDRDVKSICQMLVSQLVLRLLSLCTLGLAACNVHFPAGKTSHTSNTGKKKIAQREKAQKVCNRKLKLPAACSAELSTSAELGFSKVSECVPSEKWKERISRIRLFSLKTTQNKEIKIQGSDLFAVWNFSPWKVAGFSSCCYLPKLRYTSQL